MMKAIKDVISFLCYLMKKERAETEIDEQKKQELFEKIVLERKQQTDE